MPSPNYRISDSDSETDPNRITSDYPKRTPTNNTDERTEMSLTDVYLETAVDAGARIEDSINDDADKIAGLLANRRDATTDSRHPVGISAVVDEWLDALEANYGKRWPLVRSGERDPIPYLLRLSIYRRDGFACRLCSYHDPKGEGLTLDHCIPWSAGGPDDSDNLRTLCWPCNANRSNYIDNAHETYLRPTTWWCLDCWTGPSRRPPWRNGISWSLVPPITPETGPSELVYCAWCQRYTQSPLYLVGSPGRRLLEFCEPTSKTERVEPLRAALTTATKEATDG